MQSENQLLLNEFSRWCNWTGTIIRIDKCHFLGMEKKLTTVKKVLPKLYINNQLIPAIKLNDSFTYLWKHFDFTMSNEKHKDKLVSTFNDKMSMVDMLPLHPRNKLLIYQRYILSKISWDLTIANLNLTWTKQTLDIALHKYVSDWLEIPISGTLDITLKVEHFAGTKFCGSKKPQNFCVSRVLNFAVASSKKVL